MTEQRLKNFKSLNREILTLDWELTQIRQQLEENQETKGAYTLTGEETEHLQQVQEILKNKIRERWEERLRLENWLDEIPDSLVRQAVRLRYVEGLRWQQVAIRLGLESESTARIMVSRFLRK